MIIGTGIDIVETDRIQKAIERWGEHFLNHVFNAEEIAYAGQHKFPYSHYAVRFAAKEAVFKALGDASIGWRDLTIINDPDGKPRCVINKNKDAGKKIFLSLSHSKAYAVASAVVTA